ncbi:AtpZ/AtpI family protein [Chloroflexota bacterium]|nr:AtpZ/AtpI family protein [Chloroflexota bacterium]
MPIKKEDFQEEDIPETVQNPQSPKIWRKGDGQNGLTLLAQVTTISWNLALPPIGGAILGHYIDGKTDGGITWTLSLLILGVMVAFSNLYSLYIEHGRQIKTNQDQSSDSDKENHENE